MKKKRRTKRATYWGMAATTTSKDWGLGPIPGKGGNTSNSLVGDTMFHRERKECKNNGQQS